MAAMELLEDLINKYGIRNTSNNKEYSKSSPTTRTLTQNESVIYKYLDTPKYIPYDLLTLINDYYPTIKLYGIGENSCGKFGIGKIKFLQKFTFLSEMSSLCDFDDEIYSHLHRFVIFKKSTNKIYSAGPNTYVGYERMMKDQQNGHRHDTFITSMDMKSLIDQNDNISIFMDSGSFDGGGPIFLTKNKNLYEFDANYSRHPRKPNYKTSDFKAEIFDENCLEILKNLDIVSIKAGEKHIMFLLRNGMVYTMAFMQMGEIEYKCFGLPYSTKIPWNKPYHVLSLSKYIIKQIDCGSNHTLCIDDKNNLIAFGENRDGELGLGHNKFTDKIEINEYFIKREIKIKSVYCEGQCSFIVDINGNGYTFGDNKHGQIGNGKQGKQEYVDEPYLLSTIKNIIFVSLSRWHTCVLCENQNLYTFGWNASHQCSSKINDKYICNPYLLTKNEIGIDEKDKIIKITSGGASTVILVNQH